MNEKVKRRPNNLPERESEYLQEEQFMKKRRIIFLIVICIIVIMLFRACADDKHITQKDAEEIAAALTGGEATFVSSGKKENQNTLYYVFTDTRGNTFTITSALCEFGMDGAIAEGSPLELHIENDYYHVMVENNEDKIREILERYGLSDRMAGNDFTGMLFEVNAGTPEENQEILSRFVAAGIEIDALLDINTDRKLLEKKYVFYEHEIPHMTITFYKSLEDKGNREAFIDGAGYHFSLSPDTRWTFDSLYEELKGNLIELEIAER